MRDLLVITPTRGRLESALRLASAIRITVTAKTDLVLCTDEDDPSYDGADLGCKVMQGPRQTCAGWSNWAAMANMDDYRFLASMSDDHLPQTPGWDSRLMLAIEDKGGTGIAYGDDGLQGRNLPTSWVMSSDIVRALGWMYCPPMTRLFCDNVIKDIGEQAGCLAYLPDVKIPHMHWTSGLGPRDQTAIDGEGAWAHDEDAYHDWQRERMTADVAKVRALL